MNWLLIVMRPFVRLSRFRHRCGYGVHSPFAFEFITEVVYEQTPYYKYEELAELQKSLADCKGRKWAKQESTPVKRLLFRIVNRVQPSTIVDAGTSSSAALYLQAAKANANYTFAPDLSELFLESGVPVDFLYLHARSNPELMRDVFRVCVGRVTSQSVFVIEGVGYTPAMKRLWKEMRQHEAVGITFDLYDLGIIFFDRSKIKQEYVVCF